MLELRDRLRRRRVSRPYSGFGATRGVVTLARGLLDQQFWCWGQDLRHPHGDALQLFGLTLERASGISRGRLYRGPAAAGAEVSLWGFGLLWQAPAGGLAVWRDEARVRLCPPWTDPRSVQGARSLTAHPHPRGREQRRRGLVLASAVMRWMADYERWALTTLGPDHRRAVLAAWSRPPVCGPLAAEAIWADLASMAEDASRPSSEPAHQLEHRLPDGVEAARRDLVEGVPDRVAEPVVEIDQVDRRNPGRREGGVIVEDLAPDRVGEDPFHAHAPRRGP